MNSTLIVLSRFSSLADREAISKRMQLSTRNQSVIALTLPERVSKPKAKSLAVITVSKQKKFNVFSDNINDTTQEEPVLYNQTVALNRLVTAFFSTSLAKVIPFLAIKCTAYSVCKIIGNI